MYRYLLIPIQHTIGDKVFFLGASEKINKESAAEKHKAFLPYTFYLEQKDSI